MWVQLSEDEDDVKKEIFSDGTAGSGSLGRTKDQIPQDKASPDRSSRVCWFSLNGLSEQDGCNAL